jgi:hypothetical protein
MSRLNEKANSALCVDPTVHPTLAGEHQRARTLLVDHRELNVDI